MSIYKDAFDQRNLTFEYQGPVNEYNKSISAYWSHRDFVLGQTFLNKYTPVLLIDFMGTLYDPGIFDDKYRPTVKLMFQK
jgi:hypothetical protein